MEIISRFSACAIILALSGCATQPQLSGNDSPMLLPGYRFYDHVTIENIRGKGKPELFK